MAPVTAVAWVQSLAGELVHAVDGSKKKQTQNEPGGWTGAQYTPRVTPGVLRGDLTWLQAMAVPPHARHGLNKAFFFGMFSLP